MEYLLLIHADPAGFKVLTPAETTNAVAAYAAYAESLEKAGIARGGQRLRDATASTTVRVRDGKTEVHHGPFIETREELAGYFLVDVPDLDVALAWAARCPGASHGVMEVRPIWPKGTY